MSADRTEASAIERGGRLLSGEELTSRLVDKAISGDYLRGFTFQASFKRDGTLEGVNNVGTHDVGHWTVDLQTSTLTLRWDRGWDNTTCRAYEINGLVELYDHDTGQWRTTLRIPEETVEGGQ